MTSIMEQNNSKWVWNKTIKMAICNICELQIDLLTNKDIPSCLSGLLNLKIKNSPKITCALCTHMHVDITHIFWNNLADLCEEQNKVFTHWKPLRSLLKSNTKMSLVFTSLAVTLDLRVTVNEWIMIELWRKITKLFC